MIRNQAYTEAFRTGLRAAVNHVTRDQVNAIANALPPQEGDAMLAGYHAELRNLRAAEEERKYARPDPRQSSIL